MDLPTAILRGLAPDGGLYLPEWWPQLPLSDLDSEADFPTTVARVVERFTEGWLDFSKLRSIAREVYARFDHPDVAPLVKLEENFYLIELFWGPTLAFKDFALQMLGRLFDLILEERGGRALIIGATSGDTGSAAMEAFRDRSHVDVLILFPKDGPTEIQRRQMTTISSPNVHAAEVEGTFDDCQDLVKQVSADPALREKFSLSTANSINFGRLLGQIPYYYWAALRVGEPVSFAIPSGNFGNAYSGYAARKMGLSVHRLIVASNANWVLQQFFDSRLLALGSVKKTLSPSMDIQIPSNLERLLFDLYGQDGPRLAGAMGELRRTGRLEVPKGEALSPFFSKWCTNEWTAGILRYVHNAWGHIIDPHTAVGVWAAWEYIQHDGEEQVVCLGTAHPAKFPETVQSVLDVPPPVSDRLATIYELPERVTTLPNNREALVGLMHRVSGA